MQNASDTEQDGPCPVGCCADIVAGKWTLLVIRDLCDGPKYFRDLENSLSGISPRTLCERLKFLCQQGLVSRTYIKALPPRTQYELTKAGRALVPLIGTMREVGQIMLTARAALERDEAALSSAEHAAAAAGSPESVT